MARKVCTECGDDFTPPRGNGHLKTCGPCTYEGRRLYKIAYRYGITADEYLNMYASQGGRCKICGIHESDLTKRLHIDHDHACCDGVRSCGKCVRGLICKKCNTSISYFEEEPKRLLEAYRYLTGGGYHR
jgi:hypothetical protein